MKISLSYESLKRIGGGKLRYSPFKSHGSTFVNIRFAMVKGEKEKQYYHISISQESFLTVTSATDVSSKI